MAGTQNDPMFGPENAALLSVMRPQASRFRAPWVMGERIGGYQRLFDYYIDVVNDPDFALQRDPKAHEKMMRDGQIAGALRIRQLATASRTIIFSPKHDTQPHREYADKASRLWDKLRKPGESLLNILEALSRGLSVQEIVWNLDDRLEMYPQRMYPVDKSRFVFNLQNELALLSPIDVFYGEALPPYTFLAHRFDPEPGTFNDTQLEGRIPFGRGLFDRVYPWFFWKMIILRLALRFSEIFASPYKVGRYPANNMEAKDAVLTALSRLSGSSELVLPAGSEYDVKFEQAPTRGSTIYEWLLKYVDNQIVKIILGTTLVMEPEGQGSYTLGQSHERTTFGRIAQFDSESMCDTLEHDLITWMFTINGWPHELVPRVTQSPPEVGSVSETIESMLALSDAGYPVSVEMIAEATGLRTARPGESSLTPLETAQSLMPGGGAPGEGPGMGPESTGKGRDAGSEGGGSFSQPPNPFERGQRKGFSLQKSSVPFVFPDGEVDSHGSRIAPDGFFGRVSSAGRELSTDIADVIARAGRHYQIITITYRKSRKGAIQHLYRVEPYSYRERSGVVFFFGFDLDSGGTKSFQLSGITKVRVSHDKFDPRWLVEFGKRKVERIVGTSV